MVDLITSNNKRLQGKASIGLRSYAEHLRSIADQVDALAMAIEHEQTVGEIYGQPLEALETCRTAAIRDLGATAGVAAYYFGSADG